MKNELLQKIEIKKIQPSKFNPRKSFNETELQEMATSITNVGLINPITVRSVNSHYEIVAGEKRFKACKLAGLNEITAIIKEITDDEILEIQIIENLQRSDIHPLDEAEGFKKLIDSKKYTPETIADKVGKSIKYIYDRLRLNELIPEVRKYFLDNSLTVGHSLLLCKLQKNDQKKAIEHLSKENNGKYFGTVNELRHWIDHRILLDLNKAVFKKDESGLNKKAGTCIQCPKRTGFNTMLFDDIDKKDYCTDPTCYNSKLDAHIKNKTEEFKANKIPLKKITNNWYCSDKEILSRDSYHLIGNKADSCEHSIQGMYSAGDDNERGKVVDICINKNCKKHYRNTDSGNSSRTKQTPEQRYERKLEIIHGQEALETLFEVAKWLRVVDLDNSRIKEYTIIIIKKFWEKLDGYTRNTIFKLVSGFDEKTVDKAFSNSFYYDANKPNKFIDDFLNVSSKADVFKVLMITALLSDQSFNAESLQHNENYDWYVKYTSSITTKEANDKLANVNTREYKLNKIKEVYDLKREKVLNSFIRINGYKPGEKETKGKSKKKAAKTKE